MQRFVLEQYTVRYPYDAMARVSGNSLDDLDHTHWMWFEDKPDDFSRHSRPPEASEHVNFQVAQSLPLVL